MVGRRRTAAQLRSRLSTEFPWSFGKNRNSDEPRSLSDRTRTTRYDTQGTGEDSSLDLSWIWVRFSRGLRGRIRRFARDGLVEAAPCTRDGGGLCICVYLRCQGSEHSIHPCRAMDIGLCVAHCDSGLSALVAEVARAVLAYRPLIAFRDRHARGRDRGVGAYAFCKSYLRRLTPSRRSTSSSSPAASGRCQCDSVAVVLGGAFDGFDKCHDLADLRVIDRRLTRLEHPDDGIEHSSVE